jgi:hypothetical protein
LKECGYKAVYDYNLLFFRVKQNGIDDILSIQINALECIIRFGLAELPSVWLNLLQFTGNASAASMQTVNAVGVTSLKDQIKYLQYFVDTGAFNENNIIRPYKQIT